MLFVSHACLFFVSPADEGNPFAMMRRRLTQPEQQEFRAAWTGIVLQINPSGVTASMGEAPRLFIASLDKSVRAQCNSGCAHPEQFISPDRTVNEVQTGELRALLLHLECDPTFADTLWEKNSAAWQARVSAAAFCRLYT